MSANNISSNEHLEHLLELKVPSRLGAKDESLFNVRPQDAKHAKTQLGWTDLCSNPPLSIEELKKHADEIRAEGLEAVVLIGQGGSSQAAMTITTLHEDHDEHNVAFRTMDSLSPIYVNHILGSSDPAKTIYLVASKSGSTIEPLMLERVVWRYVSAHLGTAKAAKRFVALTDPGSELEKMAEEKGYRLVLSTPKDVGGRFSALTAFGLFPAALVGFNLAEIVDSTKRVEQLCASDSINNPALILACFLYENYLNGRDKFSLIMPTSGQVFGLWVEQLVAESLGKDGKGILPNVEVDASILSDPRDDRSAIVYFVGNRDGFKESTAHVDSSIPTLEYSIDEPYEVFSRFIIWEYAIVMLGILLDVYPFGQPDVEITKQLVRDVLINKDDGSKSIDVQGDDQGDGSLGTDYMELSFDSGAVKTMRISNAVFECENTETSEEIDIDQALRSLFGCMEKGDYFSLNAFLPFRGYGRREALERMRNRVASRLGVVSCLEIGPRYLHSTGQLHKGGPNTGVFLVISSDEENDIVIPGQGFTLGTLAATQAQADFSALATRGRRAVHVHLKGNDSETLSRFADRICLAISANKPPQ